MDNKRKHLEFIQDVIARMNSNSFLIKGWTVALAAALAALVSKGMDVSAAFLVVPALWILDGLYLSQERRFKSLFDEVRLKEEKDIDFSMSVERFSKGRNTWFRSFLSQTLLVFYLVLGAISASVYVIVR